MREALAFAVLACACVAGGRGVPASSPSPSTSTTSTSTSTMSSTLTATATTPTQPRSSFSDVEARWAPLVPGMHVVATHEGTNEPFEVLRAVDSDLCVRVAFEASEPVTATLADTAGATLASRGDAGAGLLAADGPVCIRRGGTIRATATGSPAAHVRWVAWSTGH